MDEFEHPLRMLRKGDDVGAEIEKLHTEIAQMKDHIKSSRSAAFDEKIEARTLPPLAGLTRVQKRVYLEPWFTVGAIAAGAVTVVVWILACILPWHVELACLGGVFLILAVISGCAKGFMMNENVRLEGQLMNSSRSPYFD